MARDRRVTIEGQDLPCLRSDAANSLTGAQAREANDGGDIGHSESAGRPISAPIRSERPHSAQLHSQGQLGQHSQLVPETIRVEQHLESVFNLEQENKLGKRRAEQTESRAEVHPKKLLIDYQWQLCPAGGCDLRTKYLKDHVYKTHFQVYSIS